MTSGSISRSLVSSRRMTQTETVILIVPPRKEAAPRRAKRPASSEDHGDEEPGWDGDAVGEQAEEVDGGEEDEQRGDAELVVGVAAEEVADGVVVGVEEQGGQVVVVAGGALEVLEVAGAADGRALLLQPRRARRAPREPRQPYAQNEVTSDIPIVSRILNGAPFLKNHSLSLY
ncbi:unnamed protein product [Spirodela intermedia]|uniref:Uncharacterized protein n=1 Tax=Spirodela intermedia TaxID=51605 RepID=A0A7I8J119_SPIIN|nr:unnamed protein product [Spirodela intermedia]CAA6663926.1 unnamed protein product [Spirodela intermedia]